MLNRRNHYRLLQVQPEAPVEVIRCSFRALMRECRQHPDLGGNSQHAAELIEAYKTLVNPKRRDVYDRQLNSAGPRMRSESKPAETPAASPEPASPKPKSEEPESRRRAFERMGRIATVLYGTGIHPSAYGEMIDFSPEGMLMRCQENLSVNSTIHITSPILHAVARITHCEATTPTGQFSVGLRFISVKFENSSGTFIFAVA
jgi:curved DNA-binding protein CbpA